MWFLFLLFMPLFAPFASADVPIWLEEAPNISETTVTVRIREDEKPNWRLTAVETNVLIGKLQRLLSLTQQDEPPAKHPDDSVFSAAPAPDTTYTGLRIDAALYNGHQLPPLIVIGGQVRSLNNVVLLPDAGRQFELWTFGTAKTVRQSLLATQVMPIFTFAQCKLLGNPIIETNPRQCLLPNNNILLEVPERASVESLNIQTFDDCLENGTALIDAFPRRCLAEGGRVFTEPPRLLDVPSSP